VQRGVIGGIAAAVYRLAIPPDTLFVKNSNIRENASTEAYLLMGVIYIRETEPNFLAALLSQAKE
jgi:hypothetical protein